MFKYSYTSVSAVAYLHKGAHLQSRSFISLFAYSDMLFFSRLFSTHAAQVLPFTKLLRMVQLEKSHIECMHRFSHTKEQWVPLAVTTFAYRCQISAGPPIMSGRSILLTVFSRWDSICKGDWEKLNAGVMRRDMQVHLTLHIKSNVFINKPLACLQMACSSVPSSDNSLELNI